MKKYFIKNSIYTVGMALHMPGFNKDRKYRKVANKYDEYVSDSYMIEGKEEYVPQGIVNIGKYTLVTMYDASESHDKSIVVVLKDKDIIKKTYIYNNAHVGGIAYDEKNKNVWITDKRGTISCYTLKSILEDEIAEPIYKKIDVSNHLRNIYGNNAVAYITIHNNKIYLGNYNLMKESIMKSFDILDNGFIDLDSELIYEVSNHIQGVCFMEIKDKTYMLVSSSYGSLVNSTLKIYEFNEGTENYRKEEHYDLITPSMMEQITLHNDKLLTLYESNAKKYKSARNTHDDIIEINIMDVINNI